MAPLVITLQLDPASQARFDEQRRRYFPPGHNRVPAHLTLFHQLPDTEPVRRILAQTAASNAAFPLTVAGLRSLGRGVAYTVASAALTKIHAEIASQMAEHLIPQDRQPFRPHVVIQNKATSAIARETLAELARNFQPFTVQALGLHVWLYRAGLWTERQTCSFASGTII